MSAVSPDSEVLLRYHAFVRRLSRAAARGAGEADEVEQRVWLRVLEHPPRHCRGLATWLRHVVRSVAANLREGEAHRQQREQVFGDRTARAATDTERDRLLEREFVRQGLRSIDPEKAQVLRMRFLEGRSPSEIAGLLGEPVETVRTRVKRGLRQFRARSQRED